MIKKSPPQKLKSSELVFVRVKEEWETAINKPGQEKLSFDTRRDKIFSKEKYEILE